MIFLFPDRNFAEFLLNFRSMPVSSDFISFSCFVALGKMCSDVQVLPAPVTPDFESMIIEFKSINLSLTSGEKCQYTTCCIASGFAINLAFLIL